MHGRSMVSKQVQDFRESYMAGDLPTLQLLLMQGGGGGLDLRHMEEALEAACENGHLHVAKWFYGRRNYGYDGSPFYLACLSRQRKVATWLYGFGTEDVNNLAWYTEEYGVSLFESRVDFMWLFGLGLDISGTAQRIIFRDMCGYGFLPLAQWLHALGGIDIQSNTIRFGLPHLRVVKWMCSRAGVDIHWNAECQYAVAVHGAIPVPRWLISRNPDWAWPAHCLEPLQTWSDTRDAWIKAVLLSTRQ